MSEKGGGSEKSKFKEFDYLGWLHSNLAPTKDNREAFGIIAWLPTITIISMTLFGFFASIDNNDHPSNGNYNGKDQKVLDEQDAVYRRTHGTQFTREGDDRGVINPESAKGSVIKPVERKKVINSGVDERKVNTSPVRRIERIQ